MLKIGILGTGDISHDFMEASKNVKGLKIVGVVQRNLEKAKNFSEKYQLEYYGDTLSDLVTRVDCVYVALPNSLHYEAAHEVMSLRKHVIVDKPIVSNPAEISELVKLSQMNNVMMFELTRVMTLPNYAKIKELVQDDEPLMIDINFCKQSRKYQAYLNGERPNTFTSEYSGGALYDLGVYGVHFIVGLLGKPQSIHYGAHVLSTGVDGFGSLVLTYPQAVATVNVSKMTHGVSTLLIESTKQTITSDLAVSILNRFTHIENGQETLYDQQTQHGVSYFLETIIDVIQENDQVRYQAMLDQSVAVMDVLFKARLSAGITFDAD